MKGTIKRFCLIRNQYSQEFQDEVNHIITEYQKQGLYAEVQFSTAFDTSFNRFLYAAMVIGRESD